MRFAVPGDWSTPASESCDEVSPGLVVFRLDEGDPCDPPDRSPVASLNIEPRPYSAPGELIRTGERVGIGGLTADRWIEQWIDPNCASCPPIYRLGSGFQVSVTGDQADEILATFTDSGPRRVLQSGEIADSADWQSLSYEGIGFAAPSDWQVRDLDGSYEETVAGDSINGVSGMVNPGTCGGGQFSAQDAKVVFFGDSPINPACPQPTTIDLSPNDAIWIRPANGEERRATSGRVNGLDVSVLQADWYDRPQPNRTVELLVRNGDQSLRVSLGVGIDSSTARAVMRSLHAICAVTSQQEASHCQAMTPRS